jgi:hypothetical protein
MPPFIVFVMRDDSTRQMYRLYDFTKSQQISPHRYYCEAGKVNSADKLYLVIESIKRARSIRGLPQLSLHLTARRNSSML